MHQRQLGQEKQDDRDEEPPRRPKLACWALARRHEAISSGEYRSRSGAGAPEGRAVWDGSIDRSIAAFNPGYCAIPEGLGLDPMRGAVQPLATRTQAAKPNTIRVPILPGFRMFNLS